MYIVRIDGLLYHVPNILTLGPSSVRVSVPYFAFDLFMIFSVFSGRHS